MNTQRETRRDFLAGSGIAGGLALTGLRAQGQVPLAIPGIEAGELTKSLALKNVSVIDGTGKAARPGMTVLLSGSRIEALGPTEKIAVPQGAQVIEAGGKFLIPGLWDMHIHIGDATQGWAPLSLLTANGITGSRVMSGLPLVRQFRAEISEGKRLGPRLVVASPIIDGPNTDRFKLWRYVENAEQGRLAVRDAIHEGADFIKVYNSLSRESYFAIAAEANRHRVPFVGHVPFYLTPAECSAAGQKSIEHLDGILMHCSTAGAEWTKKFIGGENPAATITRPYLRPLLRRSMNREPLPYSPRF